MSEITEKVRKAAESQQIQWLPIASLKPYPNNPRDNKNAIKAVAESIKRFGFNVPITVDADMVIATGHTRLEAAKLLKMKKVPVIVLEGLSPEEINAWRLVDNKTAELAVWDESKLKVELEGLKGFDLTGLGFKVDEHDWFSLGDKGEAKEGEEEYQDFLDKFEAKHTTDDCYTPAKVYDAVAEYVEKTYQVSRESFVRPFYPGGDYQNEKYIPGAVVVDNPPFSILAEIIRFYSEKRIPFFLFAPALTLFSSAAMSSCSCICINVAITYENGATIATSFVTNMDPEDVRARSCPELFKAVDDANKANLAETRKELPTYSYPYEVITAPMIGRYSKYGVEFMVPRSRSEPIDSLEAQTKAGKAIFGKGLLISEKTAQAHERAEAEANERAAEARATQWELSERERERSRELDYIWQLSERERAKTKDLDNPKP